MESSLNIAESLEKDEKQAKTASTTTASATTTP